MILRFFLYLICFIIVFSYNIIDNGYLSFIVDVVFIVFSLISVIILIITRYKTTAEFRDVIVTSQRDEKVNLGIVVKNKSFFPLPYIKIFAKINTPEKDYKIRPNIYCNPHDISESGFNITFKSCGIYKAVIKRICIYDIFRLMLLPKKINTSSDILVLPRLPQKDVLFKISADMASSGNNDTVYSDTKPGDDPTEIFAVREYQPGDRIRNIHWKISSKLDNVMVKDYGFPLMDRDTVVVDIFPVKDDKEESIINELYDLLYGLIYSMMSRGFGLTVCFVNRMYRTFRIENEGDIRSFFAELFEADTKGCDSCAELYYASCRKEKNRVFYVTNYLNQDTVNRMELLASTGPVYYLIPKASGGGEYLMKFMGGQ